MAESLGYSWKPIEPLSESDRSMDLTAMSPLYDAWRESKGRLTGSATAKLEDFTAQLIRRLSVETGILERLYDVDRGTTEALVAHGFVEEFVSRSSTDIEPSRLIDICRDQEAAIKLVMDCIAGQRDFSKGFIHELHATITRHQPSTVAVDQLCKRVDIPLLRGKFKSWPNNPRTVDGSIHEYAPPEHVDTEVERLVNLYSQYRDEDPVIVAAWVHHRFTQIHPYQDGNGRVARALTTLALVKAGLLPLVIDRDQRAEYIDALEAADTGSLEKLATMFALLERNAILRALSLEGAAETITSQSLTTAVINSVAAKIRNRRDSQRAELRTVNEIALAIRARSRELIRQAFTDLSSAVAPTTTPQVIVDEGGPDHNNAHWYKFEVVQSASETGKYANFSEDHYFVNGSVRIERERLVFVTSLHHIGRELTGVMEATAFAKMESFEESGDRERVSQSFSLCSTEPFVFTYNMKSQEIMPAFEEWQDNALAVSIKEYGDQL